ncbi:cadherin-18 isoform X2 [Oncorhynchus tshawytscha]|uniref:cadherin-18 isoform X2 n=1 Tax=Oncorhynchus tshawytscha TaxID=74940 RepID=UPI000D0A7CE1|nr:cadherin-18 isoform X2 [Oncorhynchus tshawytscha]
MRIPATTACLCPLLICLCFIQKSYGTSQLRPSVRAQSNQTKHPDGERDVHHRPKRGWIWNQFFVLEEHIGPEAQHVGKLHSNSDKGDGSVRYLLTGEGAGTIFVINEVTGDIHASKSLDREKKGHYVLHAQAIDRYTNRSLEPESEFIIKVQDVNDNAPKFPDGPFAAAVPEMADVGTSVFQLTATDADDPTYGNSAKIVYSILQGQPYFSVDPKTGVIRTALSNMDREARERYSVVVQAKDMAGSVGGLSGSTTINVTLTDVNDNPPKFPQKNYQLYVPESAQIGKAVGKIKANDEDLGVNAEMRYSITNAEGKAMFSITTDTDQKEGIISLRLPLNYEKRKVHTLHIEGVNTHRDPRFSHLGAFKDTTTLRIIIGDVDEPPVFSIDYYIMDVYENSPVGTEVGTVTAQDPDSTKSPVRYFIDHSEEEQVYFTIGLNNGVIKTTRSLDREDVAWHNITVMASEVDNPSLVSHVPITIQVLDVNDNAPYIARDDEIIVCETSRAGQVIQTVRPSDKDNFANGRFSFALPIDLPVNPNFTLKDNEDNTASIMARRRQFSQSEQDLYQLPVVVKDGGEPVLSSTSTLNLRVCVCQRGGGGSSRVKACRVPAFLSTAGLSTGAFIAILLCIIILLAIVVLFVILRSKKGKKEPLIISEEDVRENVVTYDDEGGGEEDTEAFDIAALRNPAGAERRRLRREVRPGTEGWLVACGPQSPSLVLLDTEDMHHVIRQKVVEADRDTSGPPYDSLQTYSYEGRGSPTGSVSSLGLAQVLPPELSYSDLEDWVPEGHTLSRLFETELSETEQTIAL